MSDKSSYDKFVDEQINAHLHAGVLESDNEYLRRRARQHGIDIKAPQRQQPPQYQY